MVAGPEEIGAAVNRLKSGGVVAFPTETVYGLGADAFDERAVRRVFALKGRPPENPLIVHVSGVPMARTVVAAWTEDADRMARAFWPGPVTLVLAKSDRVPAIVTAGGTTVGVRCPDHPTTLALLEAFGSPLVGPSANASGRVSPTTAAHVRREFDEADVMVLDGGAARAGIESTVVSLAGARARVLRPGVIGAAEIARVLGREVDEGPIGAGAGPVESPGLLGAHYAPAARTVLADVAQIDDLLRAAQGWVVVISPTLKTAPPPHHLVQIAGDARGYAAGLYAALREADALRPALIVVERPRVGGDESARSIWAAVMDRLTRAASASTS